MRALTFCWIIMFVFSDAFAGKTDTGNGHTSSTGTGPGLTIVFIRHGEKPQKGDNLTCQGLNRALSLPAVLYAKFGVPDFTYIPAIGLGTSTRHARMFQTVVPFAARYNLTLNSNFEERDSAGLAADLLTRQGTVLLVWEHKAIPTILRALGVKDPGLSWDDDDYDSIWIVTFPGGVATLKRDHEGLHPSEACPAL
jgi:hypothetical protein